MSKSVITDEMVMIGVNAELAEEGSPPMDANHPWTGHHSMVRAALSAVAPMILEEAAKSFLAAAPKTSMKPGQSDYAMGWFDAHFAWQKIFAEADVSLALKEPRT
ncbi:MAG: hypothetical protein ACK5PJ_06805 [Ralstonia sp.]|jgi:hypothetical protein